jgi:nitrate reductase beta subunit
MCMLMNSIRIKRKESNVWKHEWKLNLKSKHPHFKVLPVFQNVSNPNTQVYYMCYTFQYILDASEKETLVSITEC